LELHISNNEGDEYYIESLPIPPRQTIKKERTKICNLLEIIKMRCYVTFIIGDVQFQNIFIIKAKWIFLRIKRKAFNIKANVWIVLVGFWNQIPRIWEMMEHCHKMFAGQVIINPIQTELHISNNEGDEYYIESLPIPHRQTINQERTKICNLLEIIKMRC
jgi:hypothetical protein